MFTGIDSRLIWANVNGYKHKAALARIRAIEKPSRDNPDQEEREPETLKEDAENWLFGPSETYLEDEQIVEMITQSSLNPELKAELKETLNTGAPHYIFDLLQTKESLELLIAALEGSVDNLPELESSVYMMLLGVYWPGKSRIDEKTDGFLRGKLSNDPVSGRTRATR